MAPKFGTSGLRGLVVELTDALVADHVRAFLASCDVGSALFLGRDLRESSPHLAGVVSEAARKAGTPVIDCGALPTPALALAAQQAGGGAIMVTGSHIPADRNGLKFYSVGGETTKTDEAAILAALGQASEPGDGARMSAGSSDDPLAIARFHARYRDAFGPGALAGARIGVYSHSSVGRDVLIDLLRDLGAKVSEFGRSESFVPVDTEAVDEDTRALLQGWAAQNELDAIVSTDGDADRPLLTDGAGRMVPGDILGQITAQHLGAEVVVTPVSSNTGVDRGEAEVVRTRIGSPFVIAAMMERQGARVVGYEANGGFLLGFDAECGAGTVPALVTRDCILPILCTLVASRRDGLTDVAARAAEEPARFTATDRIEGIPTDRSAAFLSDLLSEDSARADLLTDVGLSVTHSIETTDGLRMTDEHDTILHLRPSGNAPEFRIYAEADTADIASQVLARGLARIGKILSAAGEPGR